MAFKRISLSLNENILEYLDSEANRIGVTRSAMVALMLEGYRTQKESMLVVNQMKELMQKFEDEDKSKA